MKRILIIPLLSVFVLLVFVKSGLALNPKGSRGTLKGLKSPKIELFNGKNLSGWYTFIKNKGKNNDPNNVFTVQNGLIRVSGQDFGCITTDNEYGNYQLEIDFKWGEKTFPPRVNKARDSGVFVHSNGKDGTASESWMQAIEIQVIEGGTGDIIVVGNNSPDFSITSTVGPEKEDSSFVFRPNGTPETIIGDRVNWLARDPQWKDVIGFRGAKDVEKPHGEWNKLKIIALGSKITVYLNGTFVNYTYDVHPQKGKIQIQSEGAEIFFKRVEIKQLISN